VLYGIDKRHKRAFKGAHTARGHQNNMQERSNYNNRSEQIKLSWGQQWS
jgi:hypothetical protein